MTTFSPRGAEEPTAIELEIVHGTERQTLRVTERDMIRFPNGLIGCEEWKRFVLLQQEEEALVGVLHCLDAPGVSLLVTSPARIVPDYRATLDAADLAVLGVEDASSLDFLAILVVDHERGVITANLLGPLAINSATRIGVQVVQADSPYAARHLVATIDVDGGNRC